MKPLNRILSRTMVNRPLWIWLLEFAWQALFYSLPWLLSWSKLAEHITMTYLDGNFARFYQHAFVVSSTIPWLLASCFYFTLYYLQLPFFEQFRLQEWVWNRGDEERKKKYFSLFKNTFLVLIIGTFGMNCLFAYLVFPAVFDFNIDWASYSASLPNPLESFVQITTALLMFDTLFYWSHRLFHEKKWVRENLGGINLYKYHKDHHAYYSTTALAGVWLDALDSIITSVACGFIPLLFVRLHLVTYFQYNIVNIFHSCYDHSGYHFAFDPFQLIAFGSHNDSHNGHHSMNEGNYGLYWRHWDVLCNTDERWSQFEEDRKVALELYTEEDNKFTQWSQRNDPKSRRPSDTRDHIYTSSGYSTASINNNNSSTSNKKVDEKFTFKFFVTFDGDKVLHFQDVLVKNGIGLLGTLTEDHEVETGQDNLSSTLHLEAKKPKAVLQATVE